MNLSRAPQSHTLRRECDRATARVPRSALRSELSSLQNGVDSFAGVHDDAPFVLFRPIQIEMEREGREGEGETEREREREREREHLLTTTQLDDDVKSRRAAALRLDLLQAAEPTLLRLSLRGGVAEGNRLNASDQAP
jgi:hypothetical protein